MAYRELGTQEKGLSSRELFFLSLQRTDDGGYAQRVVVVEAVTVESEGFDYEFDEGLN